MPGTLGHSMPASPSRRLAPLVAAVAALGLTATAHADLGVDVTASTMGASIGRSIRWAPA